MATLPWAHLRILAFHLLACVDRRLPEGWQQRYRIRPVLPETFCETQRFSGAYYSAAKWINVGQTEGRDKLGTRHEYAKPVKNIFRKPLHRDWKTILNRESSLRFHSPLDRLQLRHADIGLSKRRPSRQPNQPRRTCRSRR